MPRSGSDESLNRLAISNKVLNVAQDTSNALSAIKKARQDWVSKVSATIPESRNRLRMEVGNNLYAAEKLLDLLRGQLVELSK